MGFSEFEAAHYPLNADRVNKTCKDIKDLVSACYLKWLGFEQLQNFGLELTGDFWIRDIATGEKRVYSGVDSCALCQRFLIAGGSCRGCPITPHCMNQGSAYLQWRETRRPQPLIDCLKKILDNGVVKDDAWRPE